MLLIVSKIGIDMSKWRSAKAFCSWSASVRATKSAEAKYSTRAPADVNRVADALRLAAQSAGGTENCLVISTGVSKPTLERPRPPLLQRANWLA